MFEWKHPSYYKELRKLRDEAEEEVKKQEEEKEEESEE
jgi:wobble nucleotide-excising tRNase|tara:strand:- start:1574 stop:1687 length:114 start_codon:yes stop_codon:yes gene_type:complete